MWAVSEQDLLKGRPPPPSSPHCNLRLTRRLGQTDVEPWNHLYCGNIVWWSPKSYYITINHRNILPTGLHCITITDMMIIAHGYILTNYYWIVVDKILTNICLKYPNSWHPTMATKLLTLSLKNLCKDSNAVVYPPTYLPHAPVHH